MPTSRPTLGIALRFAAKDWKVFPLSPGKKTPRFPKGHRWGDGFKNATTDPTAIMAMWEEGGANCNIGIATGPESGLFVVDVDNKVGTMGAASNDRDLRAKIEIDKWPNTTTVSTASGGHHLYFKYPGGHLLGSGSQILSHGVDHKGVGGYVVGAGSVVNGTLYAVREEAEELAVVPRGLIQCLRASRVPLEPPAPTGVAILPVGEVATFSELWAEIGITLKVGEHDYNCPWHDDTKPSLSINSIEEIWICHGCNRHGGYGRLWAEVRPEAALPGAGSPPDAETEAILCRCDDLVTNVKEVGVTGTHIKVYLVILDTAWRRGSLEIGASLRWLAEQASCGDGTAGNALTRLVSDGLIERVGTRQPRSMASVYRLCDPLNRTVASIAQSYSSSVYRGYIARKMQLATDPIDLSHDAFRWGALGSAMRTALHLRSVKKATAKDIQLALGTKTLNTIFRHLKKLHEAGVAVNEDGIWKWIAPSDDYLNQYAQISGTTGRGRLAKIQHDLDRQGWQEAMVRLDERMELARRNAKSNGKHLVQDYETGQLTMTFTKEQAIDRGIVICGGDPVDSVTGEITEGPKQWPVEGVREMDDRVFQELMNQGHQWTGDYKNILVPPPKTKD
jgi:Bifunctional DNA primase/polymerase, N-terminal/CHC2 zinc finger